MCRVAVELFRNAADVDAGTAQAGARQTAIVTMAAMHTTRFGQGDFDPTLRRHARRPHATTATADDEQVKIKSGHIWCFLVLSCILRQNHHLYFFQPSS